MSSLHLLTEDKEATRSQLEVVDADLCMITLIKLIMLITGYADGNINDDYACKHMYSNNDVDQ